LAVSGGNLISPSITTLVPVGLISANDDTPEDVSEEEKISLETTTCKLCGVDPSFTSKNKIFPASASRPVFTHPPTTSVSPTKDKPPFSSAFSCTLTIGTRLKHFEYGEVSLCGNVFVKSAAVVSISSLSSASFLILCILKICITLARGEGLFVFVFVVCAACFCALYKARLVRLFFHEENEDKSSD
jgi:hypothetical protein